MEAGRMDARKKICTGVVFAVLLLLLLQVAGCGMEASIPFGRKQGEETPPPVGWRQGTEQTVKGTGTYEEFGSVETEDIRGMKTIYLAGGCFWGTQKFFDQFDGVIRTEVGYANGPDSWRRSLPLVAGRGPTYEEVCDNSGHAETVRIDYDESRISLTKLLEYYFMVIDPVSVNRQGMISACSIARGFTMRKKISFRRFRQNMRGRSRRQEQSLPLR